MTTSASAIRNLKCGPKVPGKQFVTKQDSQSIVNSPNPEHSAFPSHDLDPIQGWLPQTATGPPRTRMRMTRTRPRTQTTSRLVQPNLLAVNPGPKAMMTKAMGRGLAIQVSPRRPSPRSEWPIVQYVQLLSHKSSQHTQAPIDQLLQALLCWLVALAKPTQGSV